MRRQFIIDINNLNLVWYKATSIGRLMQIELTLAIIKKKNDNEREKAEIDKSKEIFQRLKYCDAIEFGGEGLFVCF